MLGLFKKIRSKSCSSSTRSCWPKHRMSTVDRTKSDALMAQAAEVEDEIAKLMNNGGN